MQKKLFFYINLLLLLVTIPTLFCPETKEQSTQYFPQEITENTSRLLNQKQNSSTQNRRSQNRFIVKSLKGAAGIALIATSVLWFRKKYKIWLAHKRLIISAKQNNLLNKTTTFQAGGYNPTSNNNQEHYKQPNNYEKAKRAIEKYALGMHK